MFGKKTQTMMTVFGSLMCFGAFINAFAFGGNYGTLSTLLTFSDAGALRPEKIKAIINLLCLLIPVIAVILLKFLKIRLYL